MNRSSVQQGDTLVTLHRRAQYAVRASRLNITVEDYERGYENIDRALTYLSDASRVLYVLSDVIRDGGFNLMADVLAHVAGKL